MITSAYNRIKLDLFNIRNIVHTQTFFAHLFLSVSGPIAIRIWPVSYFAVEAEFFNCFFVFLAAVDRRRRMLSERRNEKGALLLIFLETTNTITFFGRNSPQWAMASSFTRFLDHIQRRTTVGRTPLDEWSARRRHLYLKTHTNHNRQTSTPSVGVEPTISAHERPQTYASDRAATGTGTTITQ